VLRCDDQDELVVLQRTALQERVPQLPDEPDFDLVPESHLEDLLRVARADEDREPLHPDTDRRSGRGQFSGVPYHHLLGKEYDAARLGSEWAEKLADEKVV
jgi:hypothetical protein